MQSLSISNSCSLVKETSEGSFGGFLCVKTLYLGIIFDFTCMNGEFNKKGKNEAKYALVMKDSENIVKEIPGDKDNLF